MTQNSYTSKSFSFNSDGSFSSRGLTEMIDAISPRILRAPLKITLKSAFEYATATQELLAFKSLKTLSEDTGFSRDTVRRHLAQMVKFGLLERKNVFEKEGGKQKPCLYTFSNWFLTLGKQLRRLCDAMTTKKGLDFKQATLRFNVKVSERIMAFLARQEKNQGNENATPEGSQNATRSFKRSPDDLDKKDYKAANKISNDSHKIPSLTLKRLKEIIGKGRATKRAMLANERYRQHNGVTQEKKTPTPRDRSSRGRSQMDLHEQLSQLPDYYRTAPIKGFNVVGI